MQNLFGEDLEIPKNGTPISGYRIYAPKQESMIVHNDLPEF